VHTLQYLFKNICEIDTYKLSTSSKINFSFSFTEAINFHIARQKKDSRHSIFQ
jgi:hypothetical protein